MDVETVALGADEMHDAAMVRRIALWQRLPWLPDLHTPEEDEVYWQTHLLTEGVVLGAYAENRLVGVVAYGTGWVHQLYVLPEFQGQGIGSALLSRAMEVMDDIRLWTFKRNEGARAFYERLGFTAVEETDGGENEEQEPDVLYRWCRVSEPAYSFNPPGR